MVSSDDASMKNDDEMKELWSVVAGSDDDSNNNNNSKKKMDSKPTKKQSERKPGKRKKQEKEEKKNPEEEYPGIVENYMAELEVAYEDDMALNLESKACVNKLQKLPLLVKALSKVYLHKTFIDHGVFTLLKNWLEPLPDASLPNINIRQEILTLLTTQFQFDVNQEFVKEQLRVTGLGKSIMFLSQSDEETASNRKLARELVYKWSRSIYNISTRMEDARCKYAEPMPKRPMIKAPAANDDFERQLDFYDFSSGHRKIAKSNIRSRAQIPEASCMNFIISPQSKAVKKKSNTEDGRCENIMKKLRRLKAGRKSGVPAGLRPQPKS